MLRNVFAKSVRDQRRGIAAWAIAIALVGAAYAAFYPSMNNPDMQAALDAFPPELLDALGMADITSPNGYLGSTVFGLLGPALVVVYAGGIGMRAIAGEEEAGRLELFLAHPLARRSLVLQRAAAVTVALAVVTFVLFVALVAIRSPAQLLALSPINLAAASLQLFLLGVVFGTLALAVGAATGRRALAMGAVAVVAVGSYVANTLGPAVPALAWTQSISPFFYLSAGQPLANGWQVRDALVLSSVAVALVGAAVVGFNRRDVAG
jgi:ABC-2 type transport system permease protein